MSLFRPGLGLCVLGCLATGCTGTAGDDDDGNGAGGGNQTGGAGTPSGGTGEGNAGMGGGNAGTGGSVGMMPSPSTDAGPPPQKDSGPPPVPEGKVPMFVAAGHGGRTVTSCDDGRSWIANLAYENRNVDHSPYTEKGLVYGNGIFLELIGWGAPSSVKRSTNGVDWEQVSVPSGAGGGLAYIDQPTPRFVSINGYGGCQSSRDGKVWSKCPAPNYPENLREAGGGGSAIGGGGDIAATFSFDSGRTWKSAAACSIVDGFGNLGQLGGFAFGNNAFVAVASDGTWCQTTTKGSTWMTGKLPGGVAGKMAFLGDRFWAPNGADIYHSQDGVSWTRETLKPAATVIHAIARSDAGTYVGVQRAQTSNRFYRSSDGINWTLVPGPSGTELRRVVFGYGLASKSCPVPASN